MNDNEKLLHEYLLAYKKWFLNVQTEYSEEMLEKKAVILELMNIEPVRWIDGAVQKPNDGTHIRFIYSYPDSDDSIYEKVVQKYGTDWNHVRWLLSSDFPMPLPPEVIIEKCPYCGRECMVNDREIGLARIICSADCGYSSGYKDGIPEAIEAHNKLCRRLK